MSNELAKQDTQMNIYQRLNKVRKEIAYIKKDAEVQGYKAVTHDMVTAITRDSLITNGVMVIPSMNPSVCIDKTYKSGSSYIQMRTLVDVSFINVDTPDDRHTITIEAHADDSGDKAPGKVLSYAVKNAVLKVLYLETGENDESRAVDYTPQQKQAFDQLISDGDGIGIRLMQLVLDESSYINLYNSFQKGEKVKMKARVDELNNQGFIALKSIEESLSIGDSTLAVESIDGISHTGKALLRRHLGREGVDNLNTLLREVGSEQI